MLDDLRERDWVPRNVRHKEHALTHAYATLEQQHGRPATDDEVATVLDSRSTPCTTGSPTFAVSPS